MKTKTLLIAAVMFLGISVAAFAQAQYSVSASPETTRVSTGYTEKVGDIGFNTIQASDVTVTGTITIDYGRTITTYPTSNITVQSFVDPSDENYPGSTAPDFTVSVEGNQVVITVTPSTDTPARLYSFRLSGVRVDVHGGAGNAPIDAVITATQNMIVNGQATARVLNAIQLPFAAFTNNTLQFSALTGEEKTDDYTVVLDATEQFRGALGVTIATDGSQNAVQQIKIALDRAIPAGITVTFPAYDESNKWHLVGSGVMTHSTTTPVAVYNLVADTNVAEIEDVLFDVGVAVAAPTTTVYGTDLTMYAKITLGPIATGASDHTVPRYAESYLTSDAPMYTFYAAYNKTILMIPYATTAYTYDTGIAISNTTMDPGSDATEFISPLQQDGKITFYFYPSTGDPFSFDTVDDNALLPPQDQTVIGADGLLPSGKTYVVLLDQLIKAKEYTGDFTGYVIAVCDFTHAHGQYFISDFASFTNGALMLVVNPVESNRALSVPESLGN